MARLCDGDCFDERIMSSVPMNIGMSGYVGIGGISTIEAVDFGRWKLWGVVGLV